MTRTFDTAPAPHVPGPNTVRRMMADVLVALIPAIALQTWTFGPEVLLQLALATTFALALEAAMLALRGRPLAPFLTDLSAPVTAFLFALSIPPGSPWWIALVAMIAAIVVAKHLYGGLGHNVFNPAMVGYVVVLVCFPLELSTWARYDAVAQATPLDLVRAARVDARTLPEIAGALAPGLSHAAWLALAYLAGGAYLLARRVIDWRVPTAMLGTVLLVATPPWLFEPARHPSPFAELTMGAIVMGAFFVATDPVSGCTTPRGRIVFGVLVALLTLAIRRFGSYPDGVAFAVLLANCAAPLIDRYTLTRPYGHPG